MLWRLLAFAPHSEFPSYVGAPLYKLRLVDDDFRVRELLKRAEEAIRRSKELLLDSRMIQEQHRQRRLVSRRLIKTLSIAVNDRSGPKRVSSRS